MYSGLYQTIKSMENKKSTMKVKEFCSFFDNISENDAKAVAGIILDYSIENPEPKLSSKTSSKTSNPGCIPFNGKEIQSRGWKFCYSDLPQNLINVLSHFITILENKNEN